MLSFPRTLWHDMVGHAYDGLPDEACGLLVGDPATGEAAAFFPCRNAAASSKVYAVDPRDYMRVDREAERLGHEVIGVVHSHTHTEAYPSPTDVREAPDPGWHYVIVSLKRDEAAVRSFRIEGEAVTEEEVAVVPR